MIKQWLANRREGKRLLNFRRGYDWAAGWLLSGQSLQELRQQIEGGIIDSTGFDEGAKEALNSWVLRCDVYRKVAARDSSLVKLAIRCERNDRFIIGDTTFYFPRIFKQLALRGLLEIGYHNPNDLLPEDMELVTGKDNG